MLTRDTAAFLLNLLGQQQLNVGAPDFPEAVQMVVKARTELLSIVAEDPPDGVGSPANPLPAPPSTPARTQHV